MKRYFIRAITIAVVMAVSASAFAQLTINGYYRVGGIGNIPTRGNDSVGFSDRIRLNISYAASDDMFGFTTRLQGNSLVGTMNSGLQNLFISKVTTTTVNGTTVVNGVSYSAIKYGMAYVKFLDGAVKVSAGLLDIKDYSVCQSVTNPYFGQVYTDNIAPGSSLLAGQTGNTQGAIVQIWPVENFSIAGVMRVDGNSVNLHDFGVDAYYNVPGIGKVIISSQLGSFDTNTTTICTVPQATNASDDITKSFVSAGFSYTGIQGLTATAAFRYNNLTNINSYTTASGDGSVGGVAIVEYTQGPLFADVAADLDLTNSRNYFEGEVSYLVIPQMKVRAYGAQYLCQGGSFMNGKSSIMPGNFIRSELGVGTTSANIDNDTYLYGLDLVFPAGNGKGELDVGVNYGDWSNVSFPVLVKVNF